MDEGGQCKGGFRISWPVDKWTREAKREAVQRCKSGQSSCAKVRGRSIEYGVSSIGRGRNLYAQRETGDRMISWGVLR